jgi:hypothetical protein
VYHRGREKEREGERARERDSFSDNSMHESSRWAEKEDGYCMLLCFCEFWRFCRNTAKEAEKSDLN